MVKEFSGRSQIRLQQVHPDLRMVMREARILWTGVGTFEIAEALRTVERQKELVAKGKSKTMKSRHIHGFAVDVAYFLDLDRDGDEDDYVQDGSLYIPLAQHILGIAKRFQPSFEQAVNKKMPSGVPIRWGGDWDMDGIPVPQDPDESFFDAAHFELHSKYYPDPT